MDEPFVITLNYKGAEREFRARLQVFGYSHRFHVDVEGTEVLFERDEEGSYRALVPPLLPPSVSPGNMGKRPDMALLQGIAEAIERILA
jgi:hypothetical protein